MELPQFAPQSARLKFGVVAPTGVQAIEHSPFAYIVGARADAAPGRGVIRFYTHSKLVTREVSELYLVARVEFVGDELKLSLPLRRG